MKKLDKLPPERDWNGRLLPGRQSINPNGRPKKGTGPNATLEQRFENDLVAASRLSDEEIQDIEVTRKHQLEADGRSKPRQRNEMGQFLPENAEGKGRPPLSKGGKMNTIATARKHIAENIHRVINKLIIDAEAGDTASSKILMDRFLPILRAEHHTGGIDINSLPRMIVQTSSHDTIDAEVEKDTVDNKPSKSKPVER
jgi:hypothetical protein